jgi:hypothetical protein
MTGSSLTARNAGANAANNPVMLAKANADRNKFASKVSGNMTLPSAFL